MQSPGRVVPTFITHSGVVGEVIDRLAGDPIHFESEEFNDTFRVTCDDRRFASALIDPQMMQFLLETKGAVDFETMGRWVLLISHQVPPDEMPILLGLADQFRSGSCCAGARCTRSRCRATIPPRRRPHLLHSPPGRRSGRRRSGRRLGSDPRRRLRPDGHPGRARPRGSLARPPPPPHARPKHPLEPHPRAYPRTASVQPASGGDSTPS